MNPATSSDPGDRLPAISAALYELFMAAGKDGIDALAVYQHYLYTSARQRTNTILATNEYTSQGIGFGIGKIKRAKTFLVSHGIIDLAQRRSPACKFRRVYVHLRYVPNPGGSETDPPEGGSAGSDIELPETDPAGSESEPLPQVRIAGGPVADPQMLEETKKMLGEGNSGFTKVNPVARLFGRRRIKTDAAASGGAPALPPLADSGPIPQEQEAENEPELPPAIIARNQRWEADMQVARANRVKAKAEREKEPRPPSPPPITEDDEIRPPAPKLDAAEAAELALLRGET